MKGLMMVASILVSSVSMAASTSANPDFSKQVLNCIEKTETIGRSAEEVIGSCQTQVAKSLFVKCIQGSETIGKSEQEVFGACKQSVRSQIIVDCLSHMTTIGKSEEETLGVCKAKAEKIVESIL